MKFKEGDRIKVKFNVTVDGGIYADKAGIITRVIRETSYPYKVKFDNEQLPRMDFSGNELEKEE